MRNARLITLWRTERRFKTWFKTTKSPQNHHGLSTFDHLTANRLVSCCWMVRFCLESYTRDQERDLDPGSKWWSFYWSCWRMRKVGVTWLVQLYSNFFCFRFHIFCAHQLCGEDSRNFDPKINNENLEKTMKTLLDMYADKRSGLSFLIGLMSSSSEDFQQKM